MAKSSSQERRAAWLRGFEESGLSLAEFCRREGLAYSTVLNWRRLARKAAGASVSPAFVVVEALPPEPEPPAVPVMNERGERTVAAGGPARSEGFETEDAGADGETGAAFRAAGDSGPPEPPPLRVELLLPGGAVLRIFTGARDSGGRGGGGTGYQERTAMKGGAS
jgi:transposase-like protein